MKLSPAVPMWRQVADHLRAQILDGTFPAGQVLPSEETLAREYGVSRPVIRDGIKTLVAEGFVEIRRPYGNLVRDPYARPTRTEHASTAAGDWTDTEDPTYYRTNATADHAELLAIPAGEPLLTREVIQQAAGIRRYHRLYMPFSIAEHTPWADNPQLPSAPKVYEHFTDASHTLTWTEHVRARAPIGDETITLATPAGTPLLIALRITTSTANDQPLILEETRQRADQIQLAYNITGTSRKSTVVQ
jgi:GntR family transcriptional regulator